MNYWEKRFERLKRQQMGKAETVTAAMRREYTKALTALRKEVLDWYYRYAEENEITLADARKELDTRELKAFQLTLKEYIKLAKKKDLPQKYIKMLDKASIRTRLDRSQELYIKTSRYVEELAKSQNLSMNRLLANVYEDSVYKTAYEAQKLKGEFSTFKGVAKQDIETAVSKPWASDGKDFSSRIWDNKTQLMNTLQTEMTRSFMIGEGVAPLINRIQKRFNVSFSNARRLVETETAYVQEKAMLDTYDALDVEQYQILAVLDLKTSDICRHLDKKVFDRKDAKPGITMPPFHCYCRSTTIPYIEEITDNAKSTRAARDPVTGKTVFVEGDLNYEEWYNKYVRRYVEPTGKGIYQYTEAGKIIPTISIPKSHRYSPKLKAEPNAVIEYFTLRGKQRNIHVYDENGFPSKWFHMGAHGNRKNHPYGRYGEHVHDFSLSDNSKRNKRNLTEAEYIMINGGGAKDEQTRVD